MKIDFNEAVRLKDSGDLGAARTILMDLHQRDPASAVVLAVLADVCWELGYVDEAIAYFQQSVALKPNCETLSLGLFHCLLECDRTDEAFCEMKRFLLQNESEEYIRLLEDINKNEAT